MLMTVYILFFQQWHELSEHTTGLGENISLSYVRIVSLMVVSHNCYTDLAAIVTKLYHSVVLCQS